MSVPSYNATRQAIEQYLKDNWGTTWTLLYENAPDPPTRTETWARVSIRPSVAQSADIGANYQRVIGDVYFQLFTPSGKGTKNITDLADHIATLLNQQTINTPIGVILFGNATLIYVGPTDAGNEQNNITIDYKIDS